MLKILWNTQKTPTKHALRHFKKFLKIRFLAEKSGSRLICRIMLKYHETLRKHQLNMFWGFLRNSRKSGSRLKNPVLGSKMWFSAQISNYAKIPWNTQKTPTEHVLRLLKNFLKIRFSAQTSGSRLRCRTMLKIPWNSGNTILPRYANWLTWFRLSTNQIVGFLIGSVPKPCLVPAPTTVKLPHASGHVVKHVLLLC